MAQTNVFLYVPNLIGYARIVLLGCSFYCVLDNHRLAMILYLASYGMDAIDGLAARLLNQSSLFGSILDMLTDRVSTICLLMTLGHLFPKYFFAFQILLVLDIVSHWLHFFSSRIQGKTSHKQCDDDTNFCTRLYYGNKFVLTLVCAMEQILYCSLFIYNYELEQYSKHIMGLMAVCIPGVIFKNYINLVQIKNACYAMACIDEASLYHTC